MQFSLQPVSQRGKKKSIASRIRRVTCCNLELKLVMVFNKSMQSLQKVEPSSALRNHCKPKKVARQVAKRARYTLQPICNLSRNAIATQATDKIALCNTTCIAWFYFLQPLQRLFDTNSSHSPRQQRICETIESCSSRSQRVTCIQQLAINFFFQRCETSFKQNCIMGH